MALQIKEEESGSLILLVVHYLFYQALFRDALSGVKDDVKQKDVIYYQRI